MYILNWPLPIEGPIQTNNDKQAMTNKYSIEHNYVKNPNWQEADQLAIYKCSDKLNSGLPRTVSANGQNGIMDRFHMTSSLSTIQTEEPPKFLSSSVIT